MGIGATDQLAFRISAVSGRKSRGRRAGSVIDYKAVITKTAPERSLTKGKRRANGRNHHGVITAKHRGGGNKKLYRIIDFRRQKDNIPAKVEAIE